MNKKKLNIVLLLFVLGLWGTVIYRYVSQYWYKQETRLIDHKQNISFNSRLQKKDTFEMVALNRDPFLNKSFSTPVIEKVGDIRKIPRMQKKVPVVMNVYFPLVEYYGYIKSNSETKKELVLIKSNGIIMKLKLGEEKEGLRVEKIFKDSIQISFNKRSVYVRKN